MYPELQGFVRRGTSNLLFLAFVILFSGCSLQKMAVSQTADVLYTGSIAMEREPDPVFAEQAIPASLKTLETFLVSAPENEKILELLARGYYSYAFGFIEGDLERAQIELAPESEIQELTDRAVLHYLRSREFGFQLLDKPAFEKAAREGNEDKLQSELKKLEAEDVPGLFWVGYGWASAINLKQDDSDMVARLGVVEKIMSRVEELNDDYFDGGVHFFFGVLYASRPPMFGGDPEEALKHFEIAMEKNGTKNLMIPYLYARYYATQTQNRELFVEMMHRVETANLDTVPDRRLNNTIAQKRARFWLENIDELIYE